MESAPIALCPGGDLPDLTVVEVQKGDTVRRMTEVDLALLRLGIIAADTTVKRRDSTSERDIQFEDHLREVSYDGAYLDDSGTQQQLEDVVLEGMKRLSVGQHEVVEGGDQAFHIELVAVHGPEMLLAQAALYISLHIGQGSLTKHYLTRSVDQWCPILDDDIKYWEGLKQHTQLEMITPAARLKSQTEHLLWELCNYSRPNPIEDKRSQLFTCWQNATLLCIALGIERERPRKLLDEDPLFQNLLMSPLFLLYPKRKDLLGRIRALRRFSERYLPPNAKQERQLVDLVEEYTLQNEKSGQKKIAWASVTQKWSSVVPGTHTEKAVKEIYEDNIKS